MEWSRLATVPAPRCPPTRQQHLQFGDVVQVALDALLQELHGRQQRPCPGREAPLALGSHGRPTGLPLRRACMSRPHSVPICMSLSSSTESSCDRGSNTGEHAVPGLQLLPMRHEQFLSPDEVEF